MKFNSLHCKFCLLQMKFIYVLNDLRCSGRSAIRSIIHLYICHFISNCNSNNAQHLQFIEKLMQASLQLFHSYFMWTLNFYLLIKKLTGCKIKYTTFKNLTFYSDQFFSLFRKTDRTFILEDILEILPPDFIWNVGHVEPDFAIPTTTATTDVVIATPPAGARTTVTAITVTPTTWPVPLSSLPVTRGAWPRTWSSLHWGPWPGIMEWILIRLWDIN